MHPTQQLRRKGTDLEGLAEQPHSRYGGSKEEGVARLSNPKRGEIHGKQLVTAEDEFQEGS